MSLNEMENQEIGSTASQPDGSNKPADRPRAVFGIRGTLGAALFAAGVSLWGGEANAQSICNQDPALCSDKVKLAPPEKLSLFEQALMEQAQTSLGRHYLNPNFWEYLEKTDRVDPLRRALSEAQQASDKDGKDNEVSKLLSQAVKKAENPQREVLDMLEQAIANDSALRYEKDHRGGIRITPRFKHNSPVSPHLSIWIDKEGYIREVGKEILNPVRWTDWNLVMEDLVKTSKSYMDWMENDIEMSEKDGKNMERYSKILPRLLTKLIELRSKNGPLSASEQGAQMDLFRKLLKNNPGKSDDTGNSLKLFVGAMKMHPGVIQIMTSGENNDLIIAISPEGFLMKEGKDEKGETVFLIEGDYKDAFKRRYQESLKPKQHKAEAPKAEFAEPAAPAKPAETKPEEKKAPETQPTTQSDEKAEKGDE